MGTCRDCVFWYHEYCYKVDDNTPKNPYKIFSIEVIDGDDSTLARLRTGADFGCVHHQATDKKENGE